MRQVFEQWLHLFRQIQIPEVAVAEFEYARAQAVAAPLRAHIAEMVQGEYEPARYGAREFRAMRDLGQGELRVLGIEYPHHRQPARQRLHVVAAVLERFEVFSGIFFCHALPRVRRAGFLPC